ncbi:hydrolase [Salmonella enterica subsp. enterica serovar Enteritidis]|uniref:Hydrolase n=1 Tax=Salmonella enteritidis TaxID=149539 RepID=A0A5Y3L2U4_SALEN|nr:nitrilase-related carbon-nitrogen hydrolase [Salmonella enterica]SUG84361.1 hydrolase [Salmonella enterica subsp. enterica]ATS96407.1 hydrolase [Salmonella enterica subsp. enterica serovar Enteritidis]EAQ6293246.1 hydrolase [Salmonella enterica]EBS5617372.1 hydrolase [Salmonella enterica subsp. enterica serovar Enteritidis]ECA1407452.1 hydrolase [Salmonella enterica subsp. enterica serovar Enteritidis]
MFVAAGQFVVSSVWEENAQVCVSLMAQAAGRGVSLLVLPEGILARNDIDLDLPIRAAQPLDGAFMTRLLEESAHNNMTTIFTILVPSTPGRAVNMLVALRAGHIVARYAKLHLYDAFSMQESQSIDAGTVIAPVLDVEGVKVGLMTCYDLRFPDMALALDTTCYMIAAGECGNRNIGQSRIIDPLGVTIAAAADRPALIVAEIFRERIDQVREQLPLLQQRRFAPPQLL